MDGHERFDEEAFDWYAEIDDACPDGLYLITEEGQPRYDVRKAIAMKRELGLGSEEYLTDEQLKGCILPSDSREET